MAFLSAKIACYVLAVGVSINRASELIWDSGELRRNPIYDNYPLKSQPKLVLPKTSLTEKDSNQGTTAHASVAKDSPGDPGARSLRNSPPPFSTLGGVFVPAKILNVADLPQGVFPQPLTSILDPPERLMSVREFLQQKAKTDSIKLAVK